MHRIQIRRSYRPDCMLTVFGAVEGEISIPVLLLALVMVASLALLTRLTAD
jgi:hypothetical protein